MNNLLKRYWKDIIVFAVGIGCLYFFTQRIVSRQVEIQRTLDLRGPKIDRIGAIEMQFNMMQNRLENHEKQDAKMWKNIEGKVKTHPQDQDEDGILPTKRRVT
jgi:hypothetical protein